MDLAEQPFSAFNLANEVASRTGIMASGQELTTILIVDQNTQTLQLQKDEDNYIAHIESMADHVVDFGNDQRKKAAKPPVLDFKCGQQYLTMR